MSTNADTPSHGHRFLDALRNIENDRGKMASLRRGLSEATRRDAWPVIASLGMDIANDAATAVAALFATHPMVSDARSLGQTCRLIASENGSVSDIPDSFDRRFRRLIACDTQAELAGQLGAWIRLAKSKGVGVNYAVLYNDLYWWSKGETAQKKRIAWARDFWSPRQDGPELTSELEGAQP